MSKPIIQIQGIGKQYRLGVEREHYLSLRDQIARRLSSPRRVGKPAPGMHRNGEQTIGASANGVTANGAASSGASANGSYRNGSTADFWALRDISFDVEAGETLGIIGRNGAGKSTLLKILSQITPPTEGRIVMRGRVASLLEVGTGFHPELTGRENVFLNGAILGMSRAQVKARFDEIVAFAEIERFLDTPVKRYSSGMYVRLAFAVAAHLEPEILVVDEVLAVGDAAFQKRCLNKMGSVAGEGRTVLFVSHNMATVQRLCRSAILLGNGSIKARGATDEIVNHYLCDGSDSSIAWERTREAFTDAYLTDAYLSDDRGHSIEYVSTATPLSVTIGFAVRERIPDLQLSLQLLDANGDQIFGSLPQDAGVQPPGLPGRYRAIASLPPEILMTQPYGLRILLWTPHDGIMDSADSFRFTVEEAPSLCNSVNGGRVGQIAIRCGWTIAAARPDILDPVSA
jgi:lipopolysaccharide transport system ATP-binding protein